MSGPLIVGAEDVILVPNSKSYAASRPVTEGLELVTQLKSFPTSQVVILAGTEDVTGADHFCKLNGLPTAQVVGIAPEDRHQEMWLAQWYNIERQRAKGPVRLVITAYPDVYQRCAATHQPVFLFARYGMIADYDNIESWEQINSRIQLRREALIENEEELVQ